jgi:catechol 2,3-dioxygenase-like lactoylglutathione lyase family enzyme
MNNQTKTRITGLRTVGVPVADQARALDFYTGTLGFEKRLDAPLGDGGRWIEVAPPGATVTIALVRSTADVPAGVDTGIRLVTGDAEADHAALLSGGVNVDAEVLRWPGVPPMFAFRDQDANRIVIVQEG